MKKILLITLLALTINSYSQTNNQEVFSRFRLGVSFSPDLCYRTFTFDGYNPYGIDEEEYRNETEIHSFGYTSGINFQYNFNNNSGLESGLLFSNKGYRTKEIYVNGYVPSPSVPEKFRVRLNAHFIDVPLKFNYTFGKRRLRLLTSAGVVGNVVIEQKATQRLTFANGREESETSAFGVNGATRVNLSATIGIGIDYKINDLYSFRAEPAFRHQLFSVYKDSDRKLYFYNYGLNLGLYMNL